MRCPGMHHSRMRVLFIDIDTLRPDHLGCYGYHRNTSPNIDSVARRGLRFDNCYASDAPCLPSRMAMWTGRFGIHNGAIGHGGTAADPFIQGRDRGFTERIGQTGWMRCLRNLGLTTVTVSPFGERHGAWAWYAAYNEIHNPGKCGMESAEEVSPPALDWIKRNARRDNWFLHVHFWDPHTPYRAPADFGEPFADAPLPAWLTEDIRRRHWEGCGPHSAREIPGFSDTEGAPPGRYPRQPKVADSMQKVRMMFDGYDTGVLYADRHCGMILNALADQNVLDDTVIIISSDHGELLGELNCYGDHQTADQITCRIPMIIRWPGITDTRAGGSCRGLVYHVDIAATMVELLGGKIPPNWDGRSFASELRSGRDPSRDCLVVSQAAWSCQRAVRFDDYICIHSYHDGYHGFPDVMLFDVNNDPHEQNDLAPSRPDLVGRAADMLSRWHMDMMRSATTNVDPMWTVLREGGPFHTRGRLPAYLERLRDTGRGRWADLLAAKHPDEC